MFLYLNLVIQPQQSSRSHLVQSLVLAVISRQYNLIFILFLLKFFRKTLCQGDHCFFGVYCLFCYPSPHLDFVYACNLRVKSKGSATRNSSLENLEQGQQALAKIYLPCVFMNKDLLENSHTHLFTSYL